MTTEYADLAVVPADKRQHPEADWLIDNSSFVAGVYDLPARKPLTYEV